MDICNKQEYASLPPSQIVPMLADKGEYIASESSFYRVLKANDQLHHRGRTQRRAVRKKPTTYIAKKANQVWCWDISYIPSRVRGQYWYLYLVLDIYSRKIVAWEVYDQESGELASALIERAVLAERCLKSPLVLHADNGAPMTSATFKAKLMDLGITPSHSRPRVSNDNAFGEAILKTVKYCPQWPSQGFKTLDSSRQWMLRFVKFYNTEHRHSSIRFVTPAQRHNGEDHALLAYRHEIYEAAKAAHPDRWTGSTRNWEPVHSVALNPERLPDEAGLKMAV